MADKIVVLDRGSVAQVGSPLELYNRPNGLFVADFIGSPTMNIDRRRAAAKRGAATIGIRPEHVDISTTAGEWPATVRSPSTSAPTPSSTRTPTARPAHGAARRRGAAEAGPVGFIVTPREDEPAPFRQGRPAHRLTAAAPRFRWSLRKAEELMSVKLSLAALAPSAGGVAVPKYRRPISRRASCISASATSIAPIRRSISTTSSTPARSRLGACRRGRARAGRGHAREARGAGLADDGRRAGGRRDRRCASPAR